MFSLDVRNMSAPASKLMFIVFWIFVLGKIVECMFMAEPIVFGDYVLSLFAGLVFLISFMKFCVAGKYTISRSVFALFTFMLISVIWQIQFNENNVDFVGRSTHGFLLYVYAKAALMFFVGHMIGKVDLKHSDKGALFVTGILLIISWLGFSYGPNSQSFAYNQATSVFYHLIFSEYFVIAFMLSLSIAKNRFVKSLIISVSIIILYKLDGRATILCSIISILGLTLFGKAASYKKVIYFSLSLIGIFFVVAPVILFYTGSVKWIDQSAIERVKIFQISREFIIEQFWIGNISLIYQAFGSFGYYVHNGLSMLQFYGIISFLIYIFVFVSFGSMMYSKLDIQPSVNRRLFLLLYVYAVCSTITAKYVGNWLIWLSLGYSHSFYWKCLVWERRSKNPL
jgi:hypothetical protein